MRFALILSLLIAIVAVLFALYNPDPVTINLVYYEVSGPLALVIIVSLLAGVVVGVLVSLPGSLAARWRTRRLERRVAEAERAEPVVEERPVEREVPPAERRAEGAAETQRLAEETQRLAEESRREAEAARRRAEELERRGRAGE